MYGENLKFSLLIRHISALAFLKPEEIPIAFEMLRLIMPKEALELMEWFDINYVTGRKKKMYGKLVQIKPLFAPSLWSIDVNNKSNIPRTSNHIEAWHRRFESIVRCRNPTLFILIEELQKEQHNIEGEIEKVLSGVPSQVKSKKQIEKSTKINNVIKNRENVSTIEFLRAVAYNIKL